MRDRERIHRRANGMPRRGGIGKKDPGGQIEWMHNARPVEGERQQTEIGVNELGRCSGDL